MIRAVTVVLVILALVALALLLPAPRLRVAGQPSALPRATAEAEFIAPAALAAAEAEAKRQGLRALVVHRHGHRVFEYFARGTDATAELSGGELSALPFALAIGVLADGGRVGYAQAVEAVRQASLRGIDPASVGPRPARFRRDLRPAPPLLLQDGEGSAADTISRRVWQPLRADDAWLKGRDDRALRVDCCMRARLDDWMRLGDLLLGQGSVQGERIVSPDWIRHLLAADDRDVRHPVWLRDQAPWTGEEPPAVRDAFWFDLARGARLWLAPRRGLAVLVWGSGRSARDTLIPNIVLRGLTDQAPAVGGDIDDIVPGH